MTINVLLFNSSTRRTNSSNKKIAYHSMSKIDCMTKKKFPKHLTIAKYYADILLYDTLMCGKTNRLNEELVNEPFANSSEQCN